MNPGERIKQLRIANNMTLEELGQRVGVGKSTVRKWETGAIANMRRDKIAKLAEALGTTVTDIMGLDTYPASCSIFNVRFKKIREDAGYKTQQSFAEDFHISPLLVSDWESGVKEPSLDTLVRLCDFFKVTADEMLGMVWELDRQSSMSSTELSVDESSLISDYRDASDEIREEAAAMLHRSAERCRQEANRTNAG